MSSLEDLYEFLIDNDCNTYKPVVDVDINYLYLKDNKGNKVFYDSEKDNFTIKCRIKCIKDDNVISYVDPFYMDLFAKEKEDVLSIINSKF